MKNVPPRSEPVSSGDSVVQARSDREAFGELYDLIYPDVFHYCIRRTGSRNSAEDIATTVFVSVARLLPC